MKTAKLSIKNVILTDMNKNIKKFTELAINDIKFSETVSRWTEKELADFLIQEIWADLKFGTLKCAAIDRTIEILFNLHERKLPVSNLSKPLWSLCKKSIYTKEFGIIDGYHLFTNTDSSICGQKYLGQSFLTDAECTGSGLPIHCSKCESESINKQLKPNKNVKVPEYDKLSEGFDPDKIK